MTVFEIAALICAGFAAGIANTLAGGGSLISVPLLIFLGIPATVANATSRPAIISQNILAVFGFSKNRAYDSNSVRRCTVVCALAALPGAMLGAWLAATRIDDKTFERILAGVMVAVVLATLYRKRLASTPREGRSDPRTAVAAALFFAIGFYGGFVQAGVGFLVIAALQSTTRWSMFEINAVKVAVVLAYSILALVVFVNAGSVVWPAAAALVAGQGVGGYLGARICAAAGEGTLLRIYLLAVLAFAVKLVVT